MRPSPTLLILGTLGLAFSNGANAMDGFALGGRPVFRSGPGFGFHDPGRFRRGSFFPGHLSGRSGDVNVVVQQNFVSVATPPAVPTILDLPVSAGIREAKPGQPSVIVVNERTGASSAVPLRLLSEGPRIIRIGSDQPEAPPSRGFGARIVHLAVPVGR